MIFLFINFLLWIEKRNSLKIIRSESKKLNGLGLNLQLISDVNKISAYPIQFPLKQIRTILVS